MSEQLQTLFEREQQARKQAEQQLEEMTKRLSEASQAFEESHRGEKRAAEQLRAILEQIPNVVITADHTGEIRTINYQARGTLGTTPKLARGRKGWDFLPAFAGIVDADEAQHHADTAREDLLARRSDGTEFPCEVHVANFSSVEGPATIWTVRDISRRVIAEKRRRTLETELRQAQKLEALGTMAGGIAHEMSTPIQFITDNVNFLRSAFTDILSALKEYRALLPAEDDVRIAEACDLDYLVSEIPQATAQSLEGLTRVTEILLAVKRFSHPGTPSKEANDLNQIVKTTAIVSKNQWKYVADLEMDLGDDLPMVESNAGELNQVLLNLIVNAAHAIEDLRAKNGRGKITIKTRRIDGGVECAVSDTGVGISKSEQEKIFDLFFTTKVPGRGTGQGLALVHTLITRSHGGRLWVESTPEQGATFTFTLPA